MTTLSRRLGGRIGALRRRSGATQEQLAERAEISVSFLSMIEGGRRLPHLSTVERIAAALGVPPFELLRFEAADSRRSATPSSALKTVR
jgi:transcriptional regulator with XRE-family HTH domain